MHSAGQIFDTLPSEVHSLISPQNNNKYEGRNNCFMISYETHLIEIVLLFRPLPNTCICYFSEYV